MSGGNVPRIRVPLEPLIKLLEVRWGYGRGNPPGNSSDPAHNPFSMAALAIMLDVEYDEAARRRFERWKVSGIDLDVADEWATRCGLHPAQVWPEYERLSLYEMLVDTQRALRKTPKAKRAPLEKLVAELRRELDELGSHLQAVAA